MNRIEEIKKEIAELGIKRIKVKLNSYDNAIGYFKSIMTEMLKQKNETLEWEPVEKIVRFLINWTYMIGDDINFTKGFILKGDTGRGKTFVLRAWLYFLSFDMIGYVKNGNTVVINPHVINVKTIAGEYQDPTNGGYQVIQKYASMGCIILDDIGKEDEFSRSYGNKVNVIEEIINIREENEMLTFGTTNIERMTDIYDDRTVSRMNKLFTPFWINHETDFRKQ